MELKTEKMTISSFSLQFFIFLVPFFEYGSYKMLPVCWFFWLLIILNKGTIILSKKTLVLFFFNVALFSYVVINYSSNTDLGKVISLFSWSVSTVLLSLTFKEKEPYSFNFKPIFMVLVFFCFLDYFTYSFTSVDISSYLGVESRHYTQAKPYIRSTGLFGEPGTQGIALLLSFILIKNKTKYIKFLFLSCFFLTKSPYMILGFLYYLKFGFKSVVAIIFSIFSGVLFALSQPESRLYNLITLQDSSLNARFDMVGNLLEGLAYNGIYSSDILLTDAGYLFELYYEFGYFGLLFIILSFSLNVPFLHLLKIKTFSAWVFIFMYIKLSGKVRRCA